MRVKPGLPRITAQGRRWLAVERRWPSAAAEAWVKRFVAEALQAQSTLAVVLIGSFARAAQEPDDVDVLYVHDGEPVAVGVHPAEIDLRVYAKEEFMSRLAERDDVVTWALRFGRVICQRDLFWGELIASFGGELPLPSPDIADARARRAADEYEQTNQTLDQYISVLTYRAWTKLLRKDIHPASRQELPAQLRNAGELSLADDLAFALRKRGGLMPSAYGARLRAPDSEA